jgi:uncharacterized protein
MATMTCPKCRGEMLNYERNGVTVDQCGECRGIFLDRGELEHLLAADARAHTSAPTAAPPPRSESHEYRDQGSHHGSYGSHGSQGSYKKRKKHWMEELFD